MWLLPISIELNPSVELGIGIAGIDLPVLLDPSIPIYSNGSSWPTTQSPIHPACQPTPSSYFTVYFDQVRSGPATYSDPI